jgi:DnaJ-class molecular chaperone
MQGLEILIRYKCEKCGGDGALRNNTGVVIGNCSDCSGNGRHQKWVLIKNTFMNEWIDRIILNIC